MLDTLEAYEDSYSKLTELNGIYRRISKLPVSEKREMIILFRKAIEQDVKMLVAAKAFKTKQKVISTKNPNLLKF